jgi:hypothetical protein
MIIALKDAIRKLREHGPGTYKAGNYKKEEAAEHPDIKKEAA